MADPSPDGPVIVGAWPACSSPSIHEGVFRKLRLLEPVAPCGLLLT